MYTCIPSLSDLPPSLPTLLGRLLCAVTVPSPAKPFEPFSSHCPLSLLFSHLPVQQLSSSLRSDLHARCRVYLPGVSLTCIWSREHSLFIKILGRHHVPHLGHSASHALTYTGPSVASPDIPNCLTRYPQLPHLCMAEPSLFSGLLSLISWQRPPLHFLYMSLHHPAPHPLCLLTDFSPPGIFSWAFVHEFIRGLIQ